ncbi:monovalent cation/H+ antiporter complex subunit F [Streptomyces longispororuber]|uniref:monovalent cation/H+ antiporter complex subunit F n=1 Tax=Streptomyces longispororuber TaxID=68230 RepID=UPI00210E4915|nr:monovalent cation/H+ antiporter complex subunit F [Streptomyces longispororuber]MCQ4212017.1 monovalent cation/H+ antiporter complex subunit F [Streptomyces longispororuber]
MLDLALAVILLAGALLLVRVWRGPSMLDRAVAVDVAAALMVAGIGVQAASTRTRYYLSIMLVIAFLGFTSSVGIARFIAVRDRPATPAEPTAQSTAGPGPTPEEGP